MHDDAPQVSLYRPRLPDSIETAPVLSSESVAWRNGLLIRAPNWLGDSVMCLPAIRRLRDIVPPACGLFVACPEHLADFWMAAPEVDAVAPFSGRRLRDRDLARVRRLGAGAAVVFPNSFGSALDVYRAGPALRVGRRGNARGPLLTVRLPPWRRSRWRNWHQAAIHAELAAVFGKMDVGAYIRSAMLRVDEEDARRLIQELGLNTEAPLLALAPGAAYGPAKQWPPEFFAEVAREWIRQGGSAVVTGAPGERDLAERVAAESGAVPVAGRTSLAGVLGLLSRCTAVVANDSGAMHLAAAAGCTGVAVFGSTDPTATGPIGGRWVVLRQPVNCAPCFERTCKRPERDYRCLRGIRPEHVLEALDFLLDELPVAREQAAVNLREGDSSRDSEPCTEAVPEDNGQ